MLPLAFRRAMSWLSMDVMSRSNSQGDKPSVTRTNVSFAASLVIGHKIVPTVVMEGVNLGADRVLVRALVRALILIAVIVRVLALVHGLVTVTDVVARTTDVTDRRLFLTTVGLDLVRFPGLLLGLGLDLRLDHSLAVLLRVLLVLVQFRLVVVTFVTFPMLVAVRAGVQVAVAVQDGA